MSEPRPIVLRDQVRLGLRRCLGLALSGMSYRMFRSGVTMAILALAVAFLTHMLVFGILERKTQEAAYAELERTRSLGESVTRLATKDARSTIVRALARAEPRRLEEYRGWAGATPANFERGRAAAANYERAQRELDELPIAARAVILGDRTPEEVLGAVSDDAALERLLRQHRDFSLRPPLGERAPLRKLLLDELPVLVALAERIEAGHARAIAELGRSYPERTARELLSAPPADFAARLRELGFRLDFAVAELGAFARRAADRELVERFVLVPEARARIAREAGIVLGDIDFESVSEHVGKSADRAAWLSSVLVSNGAPEHLGGARVAEIVRTYLRDRDVERTAGSEAPGAAGFLGVSERSSWLVALSFMVCMVGVANAMLMSVTERFTEIATMKCLGALDGFVMAMFVLEAVIQGLVGGAVGLVLGSLLSFLRGAFEYGSLLVGGAALSDVVVAMGLSLVAGVALAALAAVGPSFVAARLAPMEAMRVD